MGPALPGGESPRARQFRRCGIMLLVLAAFLPYHGCRAHPSHYEPHRSRDDYYSPENGAAVPATVLERVVRDEVFGLPHRDEDLWFFSKDNNTDDGPGYCVFLAVPLWLVLLGIAELGSAPRLVAGILAWCAAAASLVIIGIVVFRRGFDPIGPDWLRTPEAAAILLAAILVLAARPPHRWRPTDVEATVSTHAALGLGTALFWPTYRYLDWILVDGHGWGAVMLSLWENYQVGFWVGLAGLSLTAAPLYFSGARAGPLYHRLLPWPSPSSTPTPTLTSTGSTRTGTRSSRGPGPPGSSPS